MENTLIEVKTGKNGIQTVSARLLHEKLEVTHRFNEWFEALLKYDFVEGQDFTTVQTCTFVNNGAKRMITDYAVSVDMAKQICMLQRSDIGTKFRKYFIKCEQLLKEHIEIRNKSKVVRNDFTDTLKEHGYTKAHEYIQTTKQMKDTLGITVKKSEMNDRELSLITASELLAKGSITDEYGYHEVNPVCLDASEAVANFIAERKQKRLEQKRA
jgi:phage anti-repressor protein